MMDIWKSLNGMVEVALTSADPAAAMTAVYSAGITVYRVNRDDDDIVTRFQIRRQDYRKLKALAARRGYDLHKRKRSGLYWTAKALLKRPVLLLGMAMLLLLLCYVPSRVFFFRVEGNVQVPTKLILEKCEACGISFGASRRAVRSEKMKNALLEAIPELKWAGVNTSGCVATISVREETAAEPARKAAGVSSIVAIRDGVVTQCTVTRGNAVCKVGQAVKAGEVLVSGYTDCGMSIKATTAEGEIFAQTDRELTVLSPTDWQQKQKTQQVRKKYALIIGKKRINFYKGSGILDTTCDKMYTESYITLPGGFQLPVAIVTETWTYHQVSPTAVETQDAALSQFAQRYLSSGMIAGTILRKEEEVSALDGVFCLQGKYACHEMIGQVRNEEIIKPDE